jgi:hypothetical protein
MSFVMEQLGSFWIVALYNSGQRCVFELARGKNVSGLLVQASIEAAERRGCAEMRKRLNNQSGIVSE